MSVKVFVGSVLVSILILAPATYFLMPVLYPSMIDDTEGVLLQSEYFLFDSEARISDNDLTYQMMNGTSCLITTQGNSRLSVLFTATGYMTLNGAWTEKSEYLIDLVVDSSANRAILLGFYDYGPVHGASRILFFDITINLVTDVLIAGTHNITVFWRSLIDAVGINTFYIYDPSNNYLRSLWIQETSQN